MNILLGISGVSAAYKTPDLVRKLIKNGHQVQVVLTAAGGQFVAPLALQTVSGHPVRSELFDAEAESAMDHIELARWADTVLIAPATAHCIAQLANGLAGDLLTTLCLATTAPLVLAPAMNVQMWQHPATRDNVQRLQQRGAEILGPAQGEQACGETGPGPYAGADRNRPGAVPGAHMLNGKTVLVTAGPTWEAIDPVRGITNHSSGKMGYALAERAFALNAEVILISGPVCLTPPPGVETIQVVSAREMHEAVHRQLSARRIDLFIGVAAVADYRPAEVQLQKIKKSGRRADSAD